VYADMFEHWDQEVPQ